MKKILKYQCLDLSKALIIYYIVIALILAIAVVGMNIAGDKNTGGIGFSSEFFCLIVGLCLFREYFCLFMQNGVSRKKIFLGGLLTISILSLIMSIMDTLFLYIIDIISVNNVRYMTLSSSLYFNFMYEANPIIKTFVDLIITFLIMLIFFSAGYLIAILFYRSAKPGKVLIAVGLPLLVVGGIPVITVCFPDIFAALFSFCLMALGISSGNPFIGMLTLVICLLIINSFSYMLVRRTEI